MSVNLHYVSFREVNLTDPFFDTLREDYKSFNEWFLRKAESNDYTYIFKNQDDNLAGFLYLKIENERLTDIVPVLEAKPRIKLGTLKIDAHGTRLGERFIKKAIDHALFYNVNELYVTVFEKHESLVRNLERYGFERKGAKTTENGTELVLIKSIPTCTGNVRKDYPSINTSARKFLLALKPQWHTRLLPDSKLNNEDGSTIIRDVSHTNSINKIYLTRMTGTENLSKGDVILIYRTSDKENRAYFRSVITSICIIDEVRSIYDFNTIEDFLDYTASYSIFSEEELKDYYLKKIYPVVIRFTYTLALKKRVTRQFLLDDLKMNKKYWGFFQISDIEFNSILQKGEVNESLTLY